MISYRFCRRKERGTWGWDAYLEDAEDRSSRFMGWWQALDTARAWTRSDAAQRGIEWKEWKKPPPPTPHEKYVASIREHNRAVHLSDQVAGYARDQGDALKEAELWVRSVRRIRDLMRVQPGRHKQNTMAAVSRLDAAIEALVEEKARLLAQANDHPGHLRAVD